MALKDCSNRILDWIYINYTSIAMMNIIKATNAARIKAEILNWYAFEGLLGEVVHSAKCFFAWMDGHLIGTLMHKERYCSDC